MSRVPFPQNPNRPQEEHDSQTPAIVTDGQKESYQAADEEESNSIAARFSLQLSEAVSEQAAKAFEEKADHLEHIGRSTESADIDGLVAGIVAGIEPVVRQQVAEQLPKMAARQADSLREMARALRASAG